MQQLRVPVNLPLSLAEIDSTSLSRHGRLGNQPAVFYDHNKNKEPAEARFLAGGLC